MIAKFDSRCGICDSMILADIHEIVEVDGEWCHASCAEAAE